MIDAAGTAILVMTYAPPSVLAQLRKLLHHSMREEYPRGEK